MPGDVERKSIVGAALAVGWIVIWAFYLAQFVFPGKLPAADTGATVAAFTGALLGHFFFWARS